MIRIVVICGFLYLSSGTVFSQRKYSLKDCYDQALLANLLLKKSANDIASGKLDLDNARYNQLPSLSYNMDHFFSYGKNIDPVTNGFVNEKFSGGFMALGSELKVFSGFNNLYTIRQQKYNYKAAEYNNKKMELEVLGNVTLAFARILFNKEQTAVVRNNINKTLKELDITNEKIKLGRLGKSEYYLLNARLSTEQAELIAAHNDSMIALQSLKELLNVPYDQDMDVMAVDTSSLLAIYSMHIDTKLFINSILNNHPAILQARMNEEAARLGRKIAKSSIFPTLSVGGNLVSNYNANELHANGTKLTVPYQLNNNLGENLYVSLHVPIFSQMNTATRIRKEEINIKNASNATTEAENIIITNTLHLLNDFNASKENYKATLSAWQNNNLSYAIFEERYRLGQATSMELLTAKDILSASTSKYLNAKFELIFRHQLLELLNPGFN